MQLPAVILLTAVLARELAARATHDSREDLASLRARNRKIADLLIPLLESSFDENHEQTKRKDLFKVLPLRDAKTRVPKEPLVEILPLRKQKSQERKTPLAIILASEVPKKFKKSNIIDHRDSNNKESFEESIYEPNSYRKLKQDKILFPVNGRKVSEDNVAENEKYSTPGHEDKHRNIKATHFNIDSNNKFGSSEIDEKPNSSPVGIRNADASSEELADVTQEVVYSKTHESDKYISKETPNKGDTNGILIQNKYTSDIGKDSTENMIRENKPLKSSKPNKYKTDFENYSTIVNSADNEIRTKIELSHADNNMREETLETGKDVSSRKRASTSETVTADVTKEAFTLEDSNSINHQSSSHHNSHDLKTSGLRVTGEVSEKETNDETMTHQDKQTVVDYHDVTKNDVTEEKLTASPGLSRPDEINKNTLKNKKYDNDRKEKKVFTDDENDFTGEYTDTIEVNGENSISDETLAKAFYSSHNIINTNQKSNKDVTKENVVDIDVSSSKELKHTIDVHDEDNQRSETSENIFENNNNKPSEKYENEKPDTLSKEFLKNYVEDSKYIVENDTGFLKSKSIKNVDSVEEQMEVLNEDVHENCAQSNHPKPKQETHKSYKLSFKFNK